MVEGRGETSSAVRNPQVHFLLGEFTEVTLNLLWALVGEEQQWTSFPMFGLLFSSFLSFLKYVPGYVCLLRFSHYFVVQ